MTGTSFPERRRVRLPATIRRHEDRCTRLADLRLSEGGRGRVIGLVRRLDPEFARHTPGAFAPGLPPTANGALFLAAGVGAGACFLRAVAVEALWRGFGSDLGVGSGRPRPEV